MRAEASAPLWTRRRRDRVLAQPLNATNQSAYGVAWTGGTRPGASSQERQTRTNPTRLVPAEFRTDAGALAGPNRHAGSVRTAHARSEPATQRAAVRHASPDHHSAADERAIPNADVSTHLHRAAHDRADGNHGADAGS